MTDEMKKVAEEYLSKFKSKGWVYRKSNGKWSFRMKLNVLPMDDFFASEGPEFESAMEAATELYKKYGAETWMK